MLLRLQRIEYAMTVRLHEQSLLLLPSPSAPPPVAPSSPHGQWVAIQPDCVPSLPHVVLVHHALTVLLLYFPLRHPELGIFTCLDGITEVG